MIWWDHQFKLRLDNLGLFVAMYKRYVDDINIAAKGTPLGTHYVNYENIETRKHGTMMTENSLYWTCRCGSQSLTNVIEWKSCYTCQISASMTTKENRAEIMALCKITFLQILPFFALGLPYRILSNRLCRSFRLLVRLCACPSLDISETICLCFF